MVRVLIQKEIVQFIQELDSMIELFTTVPFFLLWTIFGKSNYWFQIFICLDSTRLFLYDRYIKMIKSELDQQMWRCVLFIIVMLLESSFLLQYIENQHNYVEG
jgi:hypothetical protein